MLLILHVAVTWAVVGLMLIIQWVHYPLFARVGTLSWPAHGRDHQTRITGLVGPLMLSELLSAAWLAWHVPPALPGCTGNSSSATGFATWPGCYAAARASGG